ncbi:hypothetical protein HNV12_18930 [Methanococcoides sp. SA1]|nr:hypothetical protein [Methanococcoides sp. SA1]
MTSKRTIRLSAEAHHGFVLHFSIPIPTIHITVTDTGIGIPETELDKIFNEFYQIDGSSTRKYGGNGIGLHLVKYYIQMHNGKIWIDSKEGVGNSVHVTLVETEVNNMI